LVSLGAVGELSLTRSARRGPGYALTATRPRRHRAPRRFEHRDDLPVRRVEAALVDADEIEDGLHVRVIEWPGLAVRDLDDAPHQQDGLARRAGDAAERRALDVRMPTARGGPPHPVTGLALEEDRRERGHLPFLRPGDDRPELLDDPLLPHDLAKSR